MRVSRIFSSRERAERGESLNPLPEAGQVLLAWWRRYAAGAVSVSWQLPMPARDPKGLQCEWGPSKQISAEAGKGTASELA